MAAEKKLETLQDEIKLLKGELKQSLASVRDYLLNMELPSSEFSTILAALGSDGDQKVTMKGAFSNPNDNTAAVEPESEITEAEPGATEEEALDESETPPEDEDLINVEPPEEEEPGTMPEDSQMEQEGEMAPEDQLLPESTPEEAAEYGEEGLEEGLEEGVEE